MSEWETKIAAIINETKKWSKPVLPVYLDVGLMNKMLEETGKGIYLTFGPILKCTFMVWILDRTVNNTKILPKKILNTTKYTMPLKVFCHSGFKLFQWFIIDVGLRIFYEFIPMDTWDTGSKFD
jgi:hypothetical protein